MLLCIPTWHECSRTDHRDVVAIVTNEDEKWHSAEQLSRGSNTGRSSGWTLLWGVSLGASVDLSTAGTNYGLLPNQVQLPCCRQWEQEGRCVCLNKKKKWTAGGPTKALVVFSDFMKLYLVPVKDWGGRGGVRVSGTRKRRGEEAGMVGESRKWGRV